MRKLYLGIIALFALFSSTHSVEGRAVKKIDPRLDGDLIEQIIQSIPNPIEITTLMKESGVIYDNSVLNNHSNSGNYATNYKKALNLGIYSTDLGFSNIYGKTQDAIHYLDAVQDLAEGLAIDQFFEYSVLKEMAEKDNLQDLIQTTTNNFEKIKNHLHDQKRDVISALLLTGGWIESNYLTTLTYSKSSNNSAVKGVLKERIGEQKLVLERLMLLLDIYSSKPQVPELIASLRKLENIYEDVEIVTTPGGDPKVIEHPDGSIEFVSTDESFVKITDGQIAQITSILKEVRNSIIK